MKLRMFGNRILDFARSIDIMDQETFNDVIELIAWYVKDHLDVAIFAVLGEIRVDEKDGLRTLRSTRDQQEQPSYTVDKETGYASHSA